MLNIFGQRKTIFLFLMLMGVIGACNSSYTTRVEIVNTFTPSPSAEGTESPTIPAILETPTLAPTGLPPIPPLSEPEAYNLLASQLQNTGTCQLPCFWGIIPGQSLPKDMQAKLLPVSGIADISLLDPTDGEIYFIYHV